MGFKPLISPHVHQDSFDSASTVEAFAEKEVQMGTGHLVVTDHGTLQAAHRVYSAAKKNSIKPIIGLEAYVRDDNDPEILATGVQKDKNGTLMGYYKYAHCTMHAMDEQAFYVMAKILSMADAKSEKHGTERKPIFNWADLEELGAQNVTMGSSCLIGMVSRHILAYGNYDIARKYYQRLRNTVKPGNFIVELFPHHCTHNWATWVKIKFTGGNEEKFAPYKNLKTQDGPIKAEEIAKAFKANKALTIKKHTSLVAVMNNRKWVERKPQEIEDIEFFEGFVPNECTDDCPDGDVQLRSNRFLLSLAEEYGDPVCVSTDAHFVNPEDKIAQDVRLMQGNSWRFHNSYHVMDSNEVWEYVKSTLGVNQAKYESWLENGHEWASKFDNFKFTSKNTLPTSFYPSDTMAHTFSLIQKHGRMDWDDPVYVDRLKRELDLLNKNGNLDLLPYFFVCEEAPDVYLRNGILTGVGRGSAGGVLLAYLLGITHINPIKHDLSLDRFLTLDRIQSGKLPDIDMDFSHRDLLVDTDEEVLEVEMDDGSKRTFRPGEMVQTAEGSMTIEEAIENQANLM